LLSKFSLYRYTCVGLEDLAALVLDEADRLLEMGFLEEIREIVRHCPKVGLYTLHPVYPYSLKAPGCSH
jgi:superfamily II DNA/RNA helicase